MLVSLLVPYSRAQEAAGPGFPTRTLGSVAAIGDSITQAFNAKYSDFGDCRYIDTPEYNFSTSKTVNTTFSIAERATAYKGSTVPTANFAADGARMSSGADQAAAVKTWASGQAAPHLITVFLGHNDLCAGGKDKIQISCSRADRDPNNYCRTSTFFYELQMRQMLDVLVTIPSSQIAIIHPIRVSQLCNFATEKVVDTPLLTLSCQDLWALPNLFGEDGVCPSLTSCTPDRIADAYTTWVSYRDIGERLVGEYNQVGAGQAIPPNPTFGTGGVVRASEVFLQTTDAIGNQRFNYTNAFGNVMLSVCECYHPSKFGQNLLAGSLWGGVTCSSTTPCCNDNVQGDSDTDKGLCNHFTTSGSMNGLWGAGEPRALRVVKTGNGTGLVTSTPGGINCGNDCNEFFTQGTVVALTPSASVNSTFAGWSGGGCSGTGACSVTMDSAKSVTAAFMGPQKLTVTKQRVSNGTGTVASDPSGISCPTGCTRTNAIYPFQQNVTLTAIADSSSVFTGWLPVALCPGTSPCTVTMDKARNITAKFTGPQTLTVRKVSIRKGTGTVTSSPGAINCGPTCKDRFTYNTSVVLTAQAGTGSVFSGWLPASICPGTGPCMVTMDKARNIAAKFTK
jgi:hypothetical protein